MTNKTITFTFDETAFGVSSAGTRIKKITEYIPVDHGYKMKVEITVPEVCTRTHTFKLVMQEKTFGFEECRGELNRLIREEGLKK